MQSQEMKQESAPATARTQHYEEQEVEDKVVLVNPVGEEARVLVLHQAAQRWNRKEIVQHMKKSIPHLNNLEIDDIIAQVEEHANEVEEKFIKMYSEKEEEKVPVFDFEIN